MVVTVKRNLNIRRRPDSASDRVGVILMGKQIEVVNTTVGEEIDGNAIWYVDKSNNFYWSGGIDGGVIPTAAPAPVTVTLPAQPRVATTFDNIFVDYHDLVIRSNPGLQGNLQPVEEQKKIKVAVLDSGIFEDHPDFKGAFSALLPAINHSNSPTHKDIAGHGTHVAGLIGSRTDDKPGIIGVAPNCILRNIKVNEDDNNSIGDSLLNGLKELTESNVHIVNLSLNVNFDQYERLKGELERVSRFAVIVAAAGNNRKLEAMDLFFPAMAPFVISVGAISEEFLQSNPNPKFHKRLDFILPQTQMMSCSTKDSGFYRNEMGSSMTTALVTGIVANLVQATNNTHQSVRNLLNNIATPFSSVHDLKNLTLIRPL